MKIDNLLTLPDGRGLAYAEFGKPDGHPVLYCHGAPGSRLEPLMLGEDDHVSMTRHFDEIAKALMPD